MTSALMAIWPDRYEKEYPIWGKKVVLGQIANPIIEEINSIAAQRPPENQMQDLAVLVVAASIVSIDGESFKDLETGRELTLAEKANEVGTWLDGLVAAIHARYTELSIEFAEVVKAATSPEASGGHVST